MYAYMYRLRYKNELFTADRTWNPQCHTGFKCSEILRSRLAVPQWPGRTEHGCFSTIATTS